MPIRCDGLSLSLLEEITALPVESGIRLVCEKFVYKVEASMKLTNHRSRLVSQGWHFRYEFRDSGPENEYASSCVPDAIRRCRTRRLPSYHMHVAEKDGVYDDLHYPIGDPSDPLALIFELVRLIKDEFVP